MFLDRIALQNFKAFGERQEAPLARVTLLYGPNSSGKSSLIQSLLLLKQSQRMSPRATSGIVTRGPIVDLGGFRNIVHGHAPDVSPLIGLSVAGRATYEFTLAETGADAVSGSIRQFTVESERHGRCSFEIEKPIAKFDRIDPDPDAIDEMESARARLLGQSSKDAFAAFVAAVAPDSQALRGALRTFRDGHWDLEVDQGWLPDRLRTMTSLLADLEGMPPMEPSGAELELERMEGQISKAFRIGVIDTLYRVLRRLMYLGPVRARPSRARPFAIAQERFDVSGEHLFQDLARPRNEWIDVSLNTWARHFELPYRFEIEVSGDDVTGPVASLRVIDTATKTKLVLPDVGYGVSQLLPILVAGLRQQNGVICVEQPELHLHPRQQGHLADFLLWVSEEEWLDGQGEVAEVHRYPNQWIVETHSEALMTRIQRRIREKAIAPTDVSVIYVQPGPVGARLIELRLDEQGQFMDAWPGGFFEETYWDLFGGIH